MSRNGQAIQANLFSGNVASPFVDAGKKRQHPNPCKVLEKKIKKINGSLINMVTGNFVCEDCGNDVNVGWVTSGKAYCLKCGPKHLSEKGKRHWGLNG